MQNSKKSKIVTQYSKDDLNKKLKLIKMERKFNFNNFNNDNNEKIVYIFKNSSKITNIFNFSLMYFDLFDPMKPLEKGEIVYLKLAINTMRIYYGKDNIKILLQNINDNINCITDDELYNDCDDTKNEEEEEEDEGEEEDTLKKNERLEFIKISI